jgi:hypothetical protein
VLVFGVVAVLERLGIVTERVLDGGVLHNEVPRLFDPADRLDRVVVCRLTVDPRVLGELMVLGLRTLGTLTERRLLTDPRMLTELRVLTEPRERLEEVRGEEIVVRLDELLPKLLMDGDLETRLLTPLELLDVIDRLGVLIRGAEMVPLLVDDLAAELLLLLFPDPALCREVLPANTGSATNAKIKELNAILNTIIIGLPSSPNP